VAGISAGIVKIVWILEKDHAPLQHGSLEYARASRCFVAEPSGALGIQAKVFVENYLSR
jgi:hypothetical protein